MNIKDHFKVKEGLAYISSNKVRIASYKNKWNKKVFNALINMKISLTADDMKIGFTVEDMIRMEENRLENRINKLNKHNVDNSLIKNEYTED